MIIKETGIKDYICEFCALQGRSEKMEDMIRNHEKECIKNPKALEYIKSETRKVKLKLIELVYKELKDDKDLKTLISIKDGNYANDVNFIIRNKISNLLNNLNYDEGYHVPVTTCHNTYNQIRKIIIEKLGKTE